ncbi:hypothetical protein E1J38_012990 [Seonamhaeicola sediminis]|uniref:Uncharacterized protein n=1 Tax=Seonamhaeicola sediminis TaxID=2528206 RepID=A0A562YC92_9FLAO|nr:hypothetical protein [Seonamhaeicola sediminis]TWO31670.1 hypothetical protein E1J38_012990 [Seonamhaeicola sediminis]
MNNFFTLKLNDYGSLIGFNNGFEQDFFEGGLLPVMNAKELDDYFELKFAVPRFKKVIDVK